MYYKIYFNNRPVFLLDSPGHELTRYLDQPNILYVNQTSPEVIRQSVEQIRSGAADAVVFYHPDVEEAKQAFWKQFKVIQAAGGLVLNEKDQALCIFRRGCWDLPKGKLDLNESLETCAVREVEEETGLSKIQLEKFIMTTYHTYSQDGEDILKETYWYQMHGNSKRVLTAQTDEDITQAEWLGKDMMPMVMGNTFPAINDVLAHWI